MDQEWGYGDEIHQRGARQFGTLWLAVNVQIVDMCRRHDIEVWSEPWRTLLPKIAYEWCEDVVRAEERALKTEARGG